MIVKELSETHYPVDSNRPLLKDEYNLSMMTDEAIDKMFADENLQTDIEDLWSLLGEYIKENDKAEPDSAVLADCHRKLQQQIIGVAADMGLINWTPELYERLYGKAS